MQQLTSTATAAIRPELLERLQEIATTVAHDVEGAAHVSLIVVQHGHPRASLGSHPDAEALTAIERSVGGPALDAVWTGRITRINNTARQGTWPEYTSACQRQGIGSVAAFPIMIASDRLGVLTIASVDYFGIGRDETRLGREAAALASRLLGSDA
jgi:GAF domain-containing protein